MRWARLLPLLIAAWVRALLLGAEVLRAAPLEFKSAEATFCSGDPKRSSLPKVIDGIDAGKSGWSVSPQVTRNQAVCFPLKQAVSAGRLRITLLFLSGIYNAHFNEFSLSVTSDPEPSLDSLWEPLSPWQAYSTGTHLEAGVSSHLLSRGSALNTEFIVESIIQLKSITALRIDVFASEFIETSPEPVVSRSDSRDFVLTELRAEAFDQDSSNIALGCSVRASHALWGTFRPEFITDGFTSTFAHPKTPDLGDQFFFELDLGRRVFLDHFTVRGRTDGLVPERLSKLLLELYEEPPEADIAPVWRGSLRQDGSYPPIGSYDVVRLSEGGSSRGRYLRISSNSPSAFSPQIAEFEAYETQTPRLVEIRADDSMLPVDESVTLPAGTRWFAFSLEGTGPKSPKKLPLRWRIRDFHREWQTVRADNIAEGPCPPPGLYQLEAQFAHTDGEWDSSQLCIPLKVAPPWWMNRLLQSLVALSGMFLLAAGFRRMARRRLEAQLNELARLHALDEERARIARDMHDVVGARLTQLTVLHEIFSREHSLPSNASESLHRLTHTAREAVAALDEVVWTVNPRNDSLPNVADYLCHCATEYLLPLKIRCLQDVPNEWEPLPVQAQTRHELLLAFKEALQNVVKHAGATEVLLTLRLHLRLFEVRVEDNGRGLPEEIRGSQKNGLGNMSARLAKIGGICQVSERSGGGTIVILQVPL